MSRVLPPPITRRRLLRAYVLFERGLPWDEIAARIGYSRTTIRDRLRDLGLYEPRWRQLWGDPAVMRSVRMYLSAGASAASVAARWHVTRPTALEWMRRIRGRLHTSERNIDWTPELDAKLRQLIADGLSASQAAAVIGGTRNAMIGRARRLGLRFGRIVNGPSHALATHSSSICGQDELEAA